MNGHKARTPGRFLSRLGRSTRLLALASGLFLAGNNFAGGNEPIVFNRDIRPILTENCFACHGQDKNARKSGLRLDMREDALKHEAIVPGKPDDSGLVSRIFSNDKSKVMPPPKVHKTLTPAQKELLRRWIASGAEYQPHWAFIPPQRPPVPPVKNSQWVRTPIDAFVLKELEARGLTPALEADRRTLGRRVCLDLTGLPPSPEEIDAFVADTSPNAYERYVDRLLATPQWGEHRARYWLDAARYADTHGIHFDNYREMWSYRDWVIKAFNQNMPFDQFTIEQLAGDLLPNRTLDQAIASGFNRCNITSNEGGLIPEEYLVLYTRDRTETVARVWLGLTANCAVCHDHKFDPLSQREFYQMAAYFNNTTQGAMDGNISDTPPIVFVPAATDRSRWDVLPELIKKVQKDVSARREAARPEFEKWLKDAGPQTASQLKAAPGLQFRAPLDEGDGKKFHFEVNGRSEETTLADGFEWAAGHLSAKAFKSKPGASLTVGSVGDFENDKPFSYGAWVRLAKGNVSGSVVARMDDQHDYRGWDIWLENGKVATHIINKWPENAIKMVTREPIKADQWNHLFITYDGSKKGAGVRIHVNGVVQNLDVAADALTGTIRTQVPFKIAQRHTQSRVNDLSVQDVRVYDRALPAQEVASLGPQVRGRYLLSLSADKKTEPEKNELLAYYLREHDQPTRALEGQLRTLQEEERSIKSRGTIAHVMQEKPQAPGAFVLYRGEYDKRRDAVKPGTPKILPPMPAAWPASRLSYAKWLLMPENPLPARVTVNRVWQELFGTGLVRTSEDFGITGELPTHPELLDWLAVEFRESKWDVKKLYKLIVMSATYRQAATAAADKLEKDPGNRYLSRGPRFRMDGEMIRDYALAASGLLVKKIGGPSVKPYQPDGVWEAVAMIGSNTRDYKNDTGDKLYRRSLYTFWKRAAPPAALEIFNAPTREVCTVRRERTDTPLQALVTLNGPQFVEAARFLAEATLKGGGKDRDSQIAFLGKKVLARPFEKDEALVVSNSVDELTAFYKAHPDDAKKLIATGDSKPDSHLDPTALAAWTMVVNQVMNLDEALNK